MQLAYLQQRKPSVSRAMVCVLLRDDVLHGCDSRLMLSCVCAR